MKMLWSLLFIPLIGNAHNDCETASAGGEQVKQMVGMVGAVCGARSEALSNTQKLNGTTSQSSIYNDNNVFYSSERAIDGNETQCAHTLSEQDSWWRIDLLGVYSISCITIYNVNQNNAEINGAQIHIGNSRMKNGTANMIYANITHFHLGYRNNFTFERNVSGRYITVALPKEMYLILCEVMINGTIKDSPFVLIRENKTWEDALDHCRNRNMDLASICDEETQAWAELEAKKASTPFVWLGLHYTCILEFWFWVDDHPLKFSRWAPGNKIDECVMSGAMETIEDHLWFSKSHNNTFNFICAK